MLTRACSVITIKKMTCFNMALWCFKTELTAPIDISSKCTDNSVIWLLGSIFILRRWLLKGAAKPSVYFDKISIENFNSTSQHHVKASRYFVCEFLNAFAMILLK